ncbi:hypothetical protein LCGC14_1535080 [marine sediment metagenome]|uniref:Uncharacterized protein n=1 Tax=marine sediment metagenome TaxID=412755 RepID=A0A0F9LAH6_9ZZZZ
MSANPQPAAPSSEKHYTPQEVGELWGFSTSRMIRLFRDEPGVVYLGSRTPNNGKIHPRMHLRIPESVMKRKYKELLVK